MSNVLPNNFYEILNKSVKEDIENFIIKVDDTNKKGEGYLGQIFFISLTNKRNGKRLNVVVKQAFSEKAIRDANPIREIFLNEIYFYTKLWPRLFAFQSNIPKIYRFDPIPKCLAVISTENSEKLVLENLKYQGYVIHPRKIPVDKNKFEYIFKTYGKFHALSFAYKALHPEEYSEMAAMMFDVWNMIMDLKTFHESIKLTHETVLDHLKTVGLDIKIVGKYEHYINDGIKQFNDSLISDKNSIILHGDCWSNNMMFKYDDSGKIIDMKFLDFQLSRLGSPVCDLSYSLYSGGTKEIFDQLDYLLNIYYSSLCENLRAYGCNPDEIYPLATLKRDWKEYCQFGVTMGLMIWKVKVTDEDEILDLTDVTGNVEEDMEKLRRVIYNKELYSEISRDIVSHLYENNYLL